jgi:hypothetical protein
MRLINDDRLTYLPGPISMRNELVKSRHVLLIMFFHNLDGLSIGVEDNIPAVIELFQLQYQHLNPNLKKNIVSQ